MEELCDLQKLNSLYTDPNFLYLCFIGLIMLCKSVKLSGANYVLQNIKHTKHSLHSFVSDQRSWCLSDISIEMVVMGI